MAKNRKIPDQKIQNREQITATMDEALTRLERAILGRQVRDAVPSGEQADYIARLESENRQMARDVADMKKHCLALKASYELLAEKYQRLEDINQSAEKDLAATLQDIDQLIARQSLH